MNLSLLARLRERRLIARALMIAADELASWPIEDAATAAEMQTLLRRDYADLEGAFNPHRDAWDEALERQIGTAAEEVEPPAPASGPAPALTTPLPLRRVPVEVEFDPPPF